MSLLLDTHALLWWLADDPRLSAPARQAIGDAENPVLVSAASLWEIATKQRIGKMPHLTSDFVLRLPDVLAEERMAELAVNARHAVRAGQHAAAHRDPFDRMLVSQAIVHGLTILTPDTLVTQYPGRTTW